jgi:hypothetical protein
MCRGERAGCAALVVHLPPMLVYCFLRAVSATLSKGLGTCVFAR